MFSRIFKISHNYFITSLKTSATYIISSITFTCDYIYKYTLSDIYKLRQYKIKYIMSEGYERAVKNKQGVGVLYAIKCGFLQLIPIVYVVTNPQLITQALSIKNSRDPLGVIDEFTEYKSIITLNDKEARPGRHNILRNLIPYRDFQAVSRDISLFLHAWNANQFDDRSLQSNVTYCTANIIAKYIFGIPEVPWEMISTLQEAKKIIALGEPSSESFKNIKKIFHAQANTIFNKHREAILESNKEVTGAARLNGSETKEEQLKKLEKTDKVSGILTEGSLSTVCMGIAYVYKDPNILKNLREVIEEKNLLNPHVTFKELSNVPLLNQIWLESLRFLTPASVLIRKTSHASQLKIKNNEVISLRKNSYLFVPVRSMAHDSRNFVDPHLFNPSRYATNGSKEIGVKNHIERFTFGSGSRECPVLKTRFAEMVFKTFLVQLCGQYDLQFQVPLKAIPIEDNTCFLENLFVKITEIPKKQQTFALSL